MDTSTAEKQPTLKDYQQTLLRRRWVVISFFVICVTTVLLGTFLMTPLYRATTKVIIEGENANILNVEESSSAGPSFDIFENYLETQMAVIKSDSVAGNVFRELGLAGTPRYQKKEIFGKTFQRKFIDDIYLKRLTGTRMVEISAENPDPEAAARIANRLAELYSQDNLTRRALTFIRNQRMSNLNAEFLRLQSKYDDLSTQFGPKHPEMVALKDQIRAMVERIRNERFNQERVSTGPGEISAEDQSLLEDALLKIQENSVLSSSKMNNVGIVDKARVPDRIAKPKRLLNILLGVIAGLLGGVLLAFFVDYLDDTIKTDEDVKRHIGENFLLGSLLSEKPSKNGAQPQVETDCLVHSRSVSASAEAYRLIRTRLLWSLPKEKSARGIAVLSSIPGEGKTTVASNLAIALAQLKLNVLLVDTDIRRGRLHNSYGLSNDNGLGQYLSGDLPLEAVVQKTRIPGLSAVTCGKSVINSSQLFSSPRMTEFVAAVRKRFDMIVYDTPPMTVISDAIIFIPQLDGVLLTLRSGLTGVRVLNKAISIIKESGANLVGVVLNDADSMDNAAYNKYYQAYQQVRTPG